MIAINFVGTWVLFKLNFIVVSMETASNYLALIFKIVQPFLITKDEEIIVVNEDDINKSINLVIVVDLVLSVNLAII